jgi:hypothetical protein
MNQFNEHEDCRYLFTNFENIVFHLSEAVALHPFPVDFHQQDMFSTNAEIQDQIIYYLKKTIQDPHHAKLTVEFAKALFR